MATELVTLPVNPTKGIICVCVKNHTPKVLDVEQHHIWPLGEGGPDVPANRIWLCPTTHTNVHTYLRWLIRLGDRSRPFHWDQMPRYARRVAEHGWRRIKAQDLVA